MVDKMVLNMDSKWAEKSAVEKAAFVVAGMVVWKVLMMVGPKGDWLDCMMVGLMVEMTDVIMAA